MTVGPDDTHAWKPLGDALLQRRIDLRYPNRRKFCDDRQIDYRLIYDIETTRRSNYGRATMLDIARAYAVTPESMEHALRGGALEPLPGPLTPAPEPEAQPEPPDDVRIPADMAAMMQDTALRATIPGVRADVTAALARNPQATGRDIFPSETLAPQIWDVLRGSGVFGFDECVLHAAAARLEEERRKWRARPSG